MEVLKKEIKLTIKCTSCEGLGYDGRKRCMNCNGSGTQILWKQEK